MTPKKAGQGVIIIPRGYIVLKSTKLCNNTPSCAIHSRKQYHVAVWEIEYISTTARSYILSKRIVNIYLLQDTECLISSTTHAMLVRTKLYYKLSTERITHALDLEKKVRRIVEAKRLIINEDLSK